MDKLEVVLKNCYGISEFKHDFDFDEDRKGKKRQSYAIYAPNGSMKTSFAKTFDQIAKGEEPKEERYGRSSSYEIIADGQPISNDLIYVLKSELNITSESQAITDILVNSTHKQRYDSIIRDVDDKKRDLKNAINKKYGIKKSEIEETLKSDFDGLDLAEVIEQSQRTEADELLESIPYHTLFDQKVCDIIKDNDFIAKAKEYSDRYLELFEEVGTIYKIGVFNPTKAESAFGSLVKEGFFDCGHRVHLEGESSSIDYPELQKKLSAINSKIDKDKKLKKIRQSLAKNISTKTFQEFLENCSAEKVEYVLSRLRPDTQPRFRRDIWNAYLRVLPEAIIYLEAYNESKAEISKIESEAAVINPLWIEAVKLFNERFLDMPFTLGIANLRDATLGKNPARLDFIFEDESDRVVQTRSEVKTLSQGEKRALYLLNFIFDVEARKSGNKETLFIIDDAADSFDYKNKTAITQYLSDLDSHPSFYQIILTHNFDFLRSLSFIPRKKILTTQKTGSSITLMEAEGVNNYLRHILENVKGSDTSLYASIPFTRNIVEYTRKSKTDNLVLDNLASFLHQKDDTDQLTIGAYGEIFNKIFHGYEIDTKDTRFAIVVLFKEADEIFNRDCHKGIQLSEKMVLCIAIRIKAERWMIQWIFSRNNDSINLPSSNQFEKLLKSIPDIPEKIILNKISVTVSSNIHLNYFMYEPIIDLTIDHLRYLYKEVSSLK